MARQVVDSIAACFRIHQSLTWIQAVPQVVPAVSIVMYLRMPKAAAKRTDEDCFPKSHIMLAF
jgi:hypothetical protein